MTTSREFKSFGLNRTAKFNGELWTISGEAGKYAAQGERPWRTVSGAAEDDVVSAIFHLQSPPLTLEKTMEGLSEGRRREVERFCSTAMTDEDYAFCKVLDSSLYHLNQKKGDS